MTYNTIGYLIYLPITIFITVYVGKELHKHGYIYVKRVFADLNIATAINNMLLAGYYLVNIGYAIIGLKSWSQIQSVQQLIGAISTHIAHIVLILALLHYFNIMALAVVRAYNKRVNY